MAHWERHLCFDWYHGHTSLCVRSTIALARALISPHVPLPSCSHADSVTPLCRCQPFQYGVALAPPLKAQHSPCMEKRCVFLWCLTTHSEDGRRHPCFTVSDAIVVYHLFFAEHRWVQGGWRFIGAQTPPNLSPKLPWHLYLQGTWPKLDLYFAHLARGRSHSTKTWEQYRAETPIGS